MLTDAPDLAGLRAAAVVFNGFAGVDVSWQRLLADPVLNGTAQPSLSVPGWNLGKAAHRVLMLRWLNSWGCRIRYPRPGEPSPFDAGIKLWWRTWRTALPSVGLIDLTDGDIDRIADAYAALSAMPAAAGRRLGPTAAAKALFALRPEAIMPWDAAIATGLHGARDGAAFHRHLALGRAWARSVVAEAGSADAVAGLVGRPGMSLAKILDEYLYVTITMTA